MTKSEDMRELELYIHIPFCVQKCKYCDFLSAPATRQVQNAYMEALLKELRERAVPDRRVVSVFIGGGTPSVVEAEWINRLMEEIRAGYVLDEDAELTIEINPGTVVRGENGTETEFHRMKVEGEIDGGAENVTGEKLRIYRNAGLNRLSIGCQSASDAELARLGRIHTFRDFLDTYHCARKAGFANINVDLMSALPGQTLESWESTLSAILSLDPPPEHISVYSLIVEEGTPFHALWEAGKLELPDEETERALYWKTAEVLKRHGYCHYEISNYAASLHTTGDNAMDSRVIDSHPADEHAGGNVTDNYILPAYACRHNIGYWRRRDYLGFGIGAASLYDNVRYKNTDSFERYLLDPLDCREQVQSLSKQEQMEETMFLGLRMSDGVELTRFEEEFGVSAEELYREQIRESVEEGLLQKEKGRLILTRRGVDLANYVMAKFLSD